jgi:hypothetical protein
MTDPLSLIHVYVDRTSRHASRNALPGLTSSRETEFVNESVGVSRPMARHRQMCREINGLATGARPGSDARRLSH